MEESVDSFINIYVDVTEKESVVKIEDNGEGISEDKLDKYIKRKLMRNPAVLRISEKPIGNQGARFLADSTRLKAVTDLVIYKSHLYL